MADLTYQRTVPDAAEKAMLHRFLNNYRAAMAWKLSGLSDEDAGRPMVPSGTSLIGLAKHLAWVELYWFCEIFAGQAIDDPHPEDADADFVVEPGDTVESITELYRAHIDRADAVIEGADVEQMSVRDQHGTHFSLRWVLIHMIEETARHAGHADIIREQIDGSTGMFPPP